MRTIFPKCWGLIGYLLLSPSLPSSAVLAPQPTEVAAGWLLTNPPANSHVFANSQPATDRWRNSHLAALTYFEEPQLTLSILLHDRLIVVWFPLDFALSACPRCLRLASIFTLFTVSDLGDQSVRYTRLNQSRPNRVFSSVVLISKFGVEMHRLIARIRSRLTADHPPTSRS